MSYLEIAKEIARFEGNSVLEDLNRLDQYTPDHKIESLIRSKAPELLQLICNHPSF